MAVGDGYPTLCANSAGTSLCDNTLIVSLETAFCAILFPAISAASINPSTLPWDNFSNISGIFVLGSYALVNCRATCSYVVPRHAVRRAVERFFIGRALTSAILSNQ